MIHFILQKIRTLRWFIFLAVFFSTFIVFIGVTSISSLLYENLMAEQASYLTEQLTLLPIESRTKIELPSITTEVRLTYIGTFVFYSFAFLLIAFIFSHFAIRRINQSIEQFSQQINQIQTGKHLQNFNPTNLNFIFNELNQAFNNISELARQLGRVLNDKNLLEIKASLLSKLVIKNIRLDDWNKYISDIFLNMHQTLPFNFICVYFTEEGQQKLKIYWFEEASQASKLEAEQLLKKQFKQPSNTNDATIKLKIIHLHLTDNLFKDFQTKSLRSFQPQPKFLVHHLEKEPQIGCVQGVFIHSNAMEDIALRLRIDSILVVLLNLLGSSRAISGYTQKLETAINLSEQENTMAAEVLYGHLLVKNTDQLTGINYQICSSSRFSGDIIQVKRSPSGSVFILVADATGHGLSATITVMPVISVFNAMVQKGYQLPFILSEMNKHLVRDLPDDRFVAALLVEIDPAHNEVSIWNGAMPAALQLNQQGEVIKEFRSKNMALGILEDAMFDGTPERLALPKDGHLMIYSDGLVEQEDSNKQPFGYEQLKQQLQQQITQDPINGVIQAVLKFAQLEQPDDDVSLCQISFANLESEVSPNNTTNSLCDSLNTPFEWQMKVYGAQIAQQALPALCNEFMQAQGLSMPLKRWAFSVIHELVQKVIDTNLLKLTSSQPNNLDSAISIASLDYHKKKTQAFTKLTDDDYLELKFKCSLEKNSLDKNGLEKPATACLIIEVSDNATGLSSLMEEASLANLRTLADQVLVLQQGHQIQVRLG